MPDAACRISQGRSVSGERIQLRAIASKQPCQALKVVTLRQEGSSLPQTLVAARYKSAGSSHVCSTLVLQE